MNEGERWHAADLDVPELAADISAALATVIDPCSAATGAPLSLLDMGLIRRAERVGVGVVKVELRLTSPICWNAAPMMQAIEDALLQLSDVDEVRTTADHGLEWNPGHMSSSAKTRLQLIRPTQQRALHNT
jgi:metal-sulfur cluster biosynthetic enzyme